MKYKTKLISKSFVFPTLAFVLAIFALAGVFLQQLESNFKKETVFTLEQTVNTVDTEINRWMENRINDVKAHASTDFLNEKSKLLLNEFYQKKNITESPTLKDLRDYLNPYLKARGDEGFFIISPEFYSIASMRDSNIGTINLINERLPGFLDRVFKGETLITPPIFSDVKLERSTTALNSNISIFALTPVEDEAGKIIAAFAIRINPFRNFFKITEIGYIGRTGESYIFDQKGTLLSNSRFQNQLLKMGLNQHDNQSTILKMKVLDPLMDLTKGVKSASPRKDLELTVMAKSAIAGKSGSTTSAYRDYRGVPVVGAWTWNKKLGVGITTEMDNSEVTSHLQKIRQITLGTLIVMGLLALALTIRVQVDRVRSENKLLAEKEKVEQARDLKDKFLSLMAHDIKGPIGVNLSFCKILLESDLGESAKRDILERIVNSENRLLNLINSILKISQAQLGMISPHREWVDASSIVSNVFDDKRPIAEDKGIRLDNNIPHNTNLYIDEKLITEVLMNLVSNSLKFCKEGDVISVNFEDKDFPELIVSDSGMGIDNERMNKLFVYGENISTVGSAGERGTGLGLPLCHDLVAAHGGDLSVESNVGEGTTFHVELPH